MHAAIHTAEPHPLQAALLPELAPPPPAPDVGPRIAVWGTLLEDARHYTSTDGRSHLQVLIAQRLGAHPDAGPVQATYHYPDTGTPHATAAAAHSAAAALRRGGEVMVSGTGLYPHQGNVRSLLVMAHVLSIRPMAYGPCIPGHAAAEAA